MRNSHVYGAESPRKTVELCQPARKCFLREFLRLVSSPTSRNTALYSRFLIHQNELPISGTIAGLRLAKQRNIRSTPSWRRFRPWQCLVLCSAQARHAFRRREDGRVPKNRGDTTRINLADGCIPTRPSMAGKNPTTICQWRIATSMRSSVGKNSKSAICNFSPLNGIGALQSASWDCRLQIGMQRAAPSTFARSAAASVPCRHAWQPKISPTSSLSSKRTTSFSESARVSARTLRSRRLPIASVDSRAART